MRTLHHAVAHSLQLHRAIYIIRGWIERTELARGDRLLAIVCGLEIVRWK